MAEYSEVMKQWKRMCGVMNNCDECLLCDVACWSGSPDALTGSFKAREEIIMKWAAEHPEQVYPTWLEWLISEKIVEKDDGDYAVGLLMRCKRIPADKAEKLGIAPKEGTP